MAAWRPTRRDHFVVFVTRDLTTLKLGPRVPLASEKTKMDTTTLLIIILLLLVLFGGGWYGRGRWY